MTCWLIFGAPGSGKGTQSSLLVDRFSLRHISTGELLREAIKRETSLGSKAKEFVDQGKLVPDELVIGMVEERFNEANEGKYILDGFPRTPLQAEKLEELFTRLKVRKGAAIFLTMPTEVLVRRLVGRRICKSCGRSYHVESLPPKQFGICDYCGGELYQRSDDREEVVANRLEAYSANEVKLRQFYSEKGRAVEVNGNRGVEEVFADIKAAARVESEGVI